MRSNDRSASAELGQDTAITFRREMTVKKSVLMMAAVALMPSAGWAFTPQELSERTIERRAVEAVIWGIPAVNYDLMLQGGSLDQDQSESQ